MTQAHLIKPAVFAPLIATVTLAVIAAMWSSWWLLGIPFAIVGTICGQPNLNLVDGCLAWTAAGIGVLIAAFHPAIGTAIAASSIGGLMLGALEKKLFAVPYEEPKRQDGVEIDDPPDLNATRR